MKKITLILLGVVMSLVLCACSGQEVSTKEIKQDDSPITMLVTEGNGEEFFNTLKASVKKDLGIDIQFIYETSCDPTDQVRLDFANDNVQADIVFTSAKVDDEYLMDSCVDFLTNSHITSAFTYSKIKECTADDGGVYQLPLSTKLIGITYNETLLNELGYDVPETFEDMLELKEVCDEKGIKFAVTDFRVTGHAFNYLFHTMGSEWLSTIEGTNWIESFIDGEADINTFKEKCEYFKKWVEAGLFGSINTDVDYKNWQEAGATNEFRKTRALFCFAILNYSDGYEGPQYDDEGNETGVMLNDVHKTMPWISEDGSNNCFTYYDNSWVMLNNSLLEEDKADKLSKALQILEYMTTGEFADYTTSISQDIYLSLNDFNVGEDRFYYDFADEIKSGFIQPWYYNYFDIDTIVNTGTEIASYILNTTLTGDELVNTAKGCNYAVNFEADFDSIFEVLDNNNNNKESNTADSVLGTIEETLGIVETARLTSICGAMNLQKTLDEEGNGQVVSAALLPYAEKIEDMQPWREVAVADSVLYPQELTSALMHVGIPKQCGDVVGIWMTGAEIKEIMENKYNPACYYDEGVYDDETYGPYSYICVTKGGAELEDDIEYLVSVPYMALEKDVYDGFYDAGKVVLSESDGSVLSANTSLGFELYFSEHPVVNKENITWD